MKFIKILPLIAVLAGQLVAADTLELNFSYGSEKRGWLAESINQFNAMKVTTPDGKSVIHVNSFVKGSGDAVLDILKAADGDRSVPQIHMTSQASPVFLDLANDNYKRSKSTTLLNNPTSVALSPVVIAMWRPMAEALSQKLNKPMSQLAWSDILQLATEKRGWGAYGHDEWGQFKFGHTTPAKSNSGISAVAALYYAAVKSVTGKNVANLNLSQVNDPRVRAFVKGVEDTVIHYGESTGFFADNMVNGGMNYLSAAVLYENLVVEKNDDIERINRDRRSRHEPELPKLVAIYPSEGTFITDHPISVVNLPYVTPTHQAAVAKFVDFLKGKSQQMVGMNHGFRPILDDEVTYDSRFSPENGIDTQVDLSGGLAMPSLDVVKAILEGWKYVKKADSLTIVFDRSGSMGGSKIVAARAGAEQIVDHLNASDRLSFLAFDNNFEYPIRDLQMTDGNKVVAKGKIENVEENGGTAMRDAVATAYDEVCEQAKAEAAQGDKRIHAIFVMTDGDDTDSRLSQSEFVSRIRLENSSPVKSASQQSKAAPPEQKPGLFSRFFGGDSKPQVQDSSASQSGSVTILGRNFIGHCPERITIFSIAYESGDDVFNNLNEMSKATRGKAVKGSRENIEKLWNDLGDFL